MILIGIPGTFGLQAGEDVRMSVTEQGAAIIRSDIRVREHELAVLECETV
jgi:hypothetical protein